MGEGHCSSPSLLSHKGDNVGEREGRGDNDNDCRKGDHIVVVVKGGGGGGEITLLSLSKGGGG
jgi:hypothetical protein